MNIKTFLFASAVMLLAVACDNDAYESGNGDYSDVVADFVEAHSNKDCAFDYAVNDDGQSISFGQNYYVQWMTRPDTLYRAVMYYHKTGFPVVKPVNIAFLPTLVPRKLLADEPMRDDPVEFESVWVSKTNKYVNMSFLLFVGGNTSDAHRHVIGLIEESTDTLPDGKTIANLLFYHNQASIPEFYTEQYYISIPCDSLRTDSINLMVNGTKGMVSTRLRVKY